jgi:plastocyanin
MRKPVRIAALLTLAFALPALAAGISVGQKDKQFSKDSISIKQNDVVTFTNDDTVTHDISVREPDGSRRPGVMEPPGSTTQITFDKLGDYEVRCLIHPKMKMSVHVE